VAITVFTEFLECEARCRFVSTSGCFVIASAALSAAQRDIDAPLVFSLQ